MRGFPKWINTKQDLLNLLQDYPDEAKEWLRIQYDGRFVWKSVAVLGTDESGIEDDTHRIVESDDGRLQMELVEDPNALVFKLGFTLDEINSILNS